MTVLRRLVERGDCQRVRELKNVYLVTSPYALALPLSDEQLVQEGNPQCFFSHLTALVHHNVTDVIPNRIYATMSVPTTPRLPLGTSADDWYELPLPAGQTPAQLGDVPIVWARTSDERGVVVAYSQGASIYITDLERTLLDALKDPGKAHGIVTVLQSWKLGSQAWNLDRLVGYAADQGPVVRQRVGFLIERVGHTHPELGEWKQKLQRGGSLKLVANEPYSPVFSEIGRAHV